MAQPDIIRISDEFRAAFDARETAAFAQMSEAYVQIERSLLSQYEALLTEIAEKGYSPSRMVSLQRYKDMMRQLFAEQERYAQFVTQIISNEQAAGIQLSLDEAYALTDASARYKTPAAELMTQWNQVPFDALEAMVGFAGDGSPLMPAMEARFGSVAPTVRDTLRKGVALGWHPTKTVRALRDTLDSGLLGNALTWARTETIRASREASRRAYEANPHIVKGWRRHATLDADRTCAACFALDGKFYPMTADGSMPAMDDHPNGRCRMLPETASYSELLGIDVPEGAVGPYDVGEIQTGRQYIESLPPERQRAYFEKQIGKGAYDAWKSGKFSWDDIPKLNESQAWGNSWTVKSGADLWGKTPAGKAGAPRPVVPTFKTVEEAHTWVKDNLIAASGKHGGVVDFSKFTDENVSVLNRYLDAMQEHAAGMKFDKIRVMPGGMGEISGTTKLKLENDIPVRIQGGMSVSLHGPIYDLGPGGFERWIVDTGVSKQVAIRTVEDVAVHEMGHAKLNEYYRLTRQQFPKFAGATKQEAIGISEYAGTNYREYIAEAYTAMNNGVSQVDTGTRSILSTIDRFMISPERAKLVNIADMYAKSPSAELARKWDSLAGEAARKFGL